MLVKENGVNKYLNSNYNRDSAQGWKVKFHDIIML